MSCTQAQRIHPYSYESKTPFDLQNPSGEAQSLLDTAAKRRMAEMLPEMAPGRLRSFAEERGSQPRAEQLRPPTAAAMVRRASRSLDGSLVMRDWIFAAG